MQIIFFKCLEQNTNKKELFLSQSVSFVSFSVSPSSSQFFFFSILLLLLLLNSSAESHILITASIFEEEEEERVLFTHLQSRRFPAQA